MFDEIAESRKIYGFNNFVGRIEKEEEPDAFILSCLYEKYNDKYFQKLAVRIQHKYGVCVDGFNILIF